LAVAFSTGRGFNKSCARTQKVQQKIIHIFKGFPLGQLLADSDIRNGEIHLKELIDACGNRAANAGGRF
jgi:hypothetical protein